MLYRIKSESKEWFINYFNLQKSYIPNTICNSTFTICNSTLYFENIGLRVPVLRFAHTTTGIIYRPIVSTYWPVYYRSMNEDFRKDLEDLYSKYSTLELLEYLATLKSHLYEI